MSFPAHDLPVPHGLVGATARTSEVLRQAVDLFVLAATHERAEIRAFADLIVGLLPDAAAADRAHAAQQLAHRADTPPTIARMLALDTPEIARAVILRSPVLTSSDLVQIMRRGPEHVALVAERLDLTPDVVSALGRSLEAEIAVHDHDLPATTEAPEFDGEIEIESLVADAIRLRSFADADAEAEGALQRALDELAAELEAEARADEKEEEAARALRASMPTVAGDIEAFLSRDSAGRWRYIQEFGSVGALASTPQRRRRGDDPAVIGKRLFEALVAGDCDRLAAGIAEAARLERPIVDRILTDRHGEAFAVTLAALGIDERTATSILLLHSGERATLDHMQDLSAMAGRIGWRTAEQILSDWRGSSTDTRGEARRLLDPAERRGIGGREAITGETTRSLEETRRRAEVG